MTDKLDTARRANLDAESRAMIFHGASVNQLAEIFRRRPLDVMRLMAEVEPTGTGRQGNPLYRIRDAAERLVRVEITEEMVISNLERLNPKNMPPLINKLFWEGMSSRRKYQETVGEMWLTDDVLKAASEAFQSLRMSLLLIPDTLRDETDIDERHVALVQGIIDDALEQAREKLVTDIRKPSGHLSQPSRDEKLSVGEDDVL